jgi:histone-binding protein RBBP4
MSGDDIGTEAMEEKVINEEYKIWKKNTPFLYDLVATHALEWPSLTVEWLPNKTVAEGDSLSTQKLVLGTHTSDGSGNQLMVGSVKLPLEDTEVDPRQYDDETGQLGGFGGKDAKINIDVRINHDGEVNRARYMPQNSFLIATKTVSGEVCLWDYSKHPSQPKDEAVKPQLKLLGHEKEGYGLAWSVQQQGYLASGADDGLVCVWNVDSHISSRGSPTLGALHTLGGHRAVVEDVAWHPHHSELLYSASDDKSVMIWDLRDATSPKSVVTGHAAEVNGVAPNPFQEFLFATASGDKTVGFWDLRNLSGPLHTAEGHGDEVFLLEWSPFNESILATAAADRRVHVWDLARIGLEQTEEDAEDGPPELLFVHGGHTAKVSDLSWNPHDDWVIASVAEDNILQVWQMSEHIYNETSPVKVTDELVEEMEGGDA